MARIDLMSWAQARADASPIRFTVFVEEQGVPFAIEIDEQDPVCVHAIAYEYGKPVGTGRLRPDGHIGRMAVLKEWRNRGIGGQLLVKLMEAAKLRGDKQVVLSAQINAARFYEAHGFDRHGDEYMEAGIRHQEMRRTL